MFKVVGKHVFNVLDRSVFKRICLALLTSLCLMPFDRCVCVFNVVDKSMYLISLKNLCA